VRTTVEYAAHQAGRPVQLLRRAAHACDLAYLRYAV